MKIDLSNIIFSQKSSNVFFLIEQNDNNAALVVEGELLLSFQLLINQNPGINVFDQFVKQWKKEFSVSELEKIQDIYTFKKNSYILNVSSQLFEMRFINLRNNIIVQKIAIHDFSELIQSYGLIGDTPEDECTYHEDGTVTGPCPPPSGGY